MNQIYPHEWLMCETAVTGGSYPDGLQLYIALHEILQARSATFVDPEKWNFCRLWN